MKYKYFLLALAAILYIGFNSQSVFGVTVCSNSLKWYYTDRECDSNCKDVCGALAPDCRKYDDWECWCCFTCSDTVKPSCNSYTSVNTCYYSGTTECTTTGWSQCSYKTSTRPSCEHYKSGDGKTCFYSGTTSCSSAGWTTCSYVEDIDKQCADAVCKADGWNNTPCAPPPTIKSCTDDGIATTNCKASSCNSYNDCASITTCTCPSGFYACSGACTTAAATCTDECKSSGTTQCSGTGYQTCGNYDTDTCLEWSSVTACTYGCTAGGCNECSVSADCQEKPVDNPCTVNTCYKEPLGLQSNACQKTDVTDGNPCTTTDNKAGTCKAGVCQSATAQKTISVTSPNGREIWTIGSTYTIKWTSTGTINNVDIRISRDGGNLWSDIATSAVNTGSYSWTVDGTATVYALINVKDSNSIVQDSSDNTFKISEAAPTVCSSSNPCTVTCGQTTNIPSATISSTSWGYWKLDVSGDKKVTVKNNPSLTLDSTLLVNANKVDENNVCWSWGIGVGISESCSFQNTGTNTYYIIITPQSSTSGTDYPTVTCVSPVATQITDFSFIPATITLEQQTFVTGRLKTSWGAGIGGKTINLRVYNPSTLLWDFVKSGTTYTSINIGYVEFEWKPSYLGTKDYKLEFAGDADYSGSWSDAKSLTVNPPVTVYHDINYGGVESRPVTTDIPDLSKISISGPCKNWFGTNIGWNDCISSIKVSSGYIAILYRHAATLQNGYYAYQGPYITKTLDDTDLRDDKFSDGSGVDNEISAIQVSPFCPIIPTDLAGKVELKKTTDATYSSSITVASGSQVDIRVNGTVNTWERSMYGLGVLYRDVTGDNVRDWEYCCCSQECYDTAVKVGCAYVPSSGYCSSRLTNSCSNVWRTGSLSIGTASYEGGVYDYNPTTGGRVIQPTPASVRVAECYGTQEEADAMCPVDNNPASSTYKVKGKCNLATYKCEYSACIDNSYCAIDYCCEKVIGKDANNDGDALDCVYIGSITQPYLCTKQ